MANAFQTLMIRVFGSRFGNMDELEDQIAAMPGVHRWTKDSPTRFEIMKESMKRKRGGPELSMMPIMVPTSFGLLKSLRSLVKNPATPKTTAPEGFIQELETWVKDLGVTSVGYAKVPERWIFQNKAVLHDNAIVMTMEMDKKRIDTAPSLAGEKAVMEIYRDLGRVANKAADYLRERGYSTHAGHPLMGQVLYPPLAQMAGLGWLGVSGLLITPEHGPRVRLAAVYTSIENLPFSTESEHQWVEDYCAACQVCIRQCPADAILTEPIDHGNGQITYVVNERCFPYFSDYYGCSVCIKVCPFNHVAYDKLKKSPGQRVL